MVSVGSRSHIRRFGDPILTLLPCALVTIFPAGLSGTHLSLCDATLRRI